MKRGNLGQQQNHWRVGEMLEGSWGAVQLGVLEQKVERKTVDFKLWGKGKKTTCSSGAARRVDGKHVLGQSRR